MKSLAIVVASFLLLGSVGDSYGAAVTIRDPAFDLPHICADTDVEAAREQGFAAGRDRMGQFLLVMSVARGTLHRALGNLGVSAAGDIETRRTGYSSPEYKAMFDSLSPSAQAILLAYADGVNDAIQDMRQTFPTIPVPLEFRFFAQNVVAGVNNIFGNATALTQGELGDQNYSMSSQFTPELALAFAVLQIRNFGFEAWDELGMAEDLAKLVDAYGMATGTELWDDRHWKNDPLQPVSVPDSRNPGFGGPLASLTIEDRIEVAEAVGRIEDRVLGRTRLPGYPLRDYKKAIEPWLAARAERERVARAWGAWPALGSYAMMVAPGRSATGNPWIGGYPQTGIQVPSIMHYSEIRGDTIRGNGMVFVGGPYVLIGHTDTVSFTTTTAHLKVIDSYIEELVGGNFDLFKYDNHGVTADMVKRVELVHRPNNAPPFEVPVFRTGRTCSVNGCNGGTRPVVAFSGDFAGVVDSATGTSITDAGAGLTPAALAGGHVAIVDGKGAGQIRVISGNTADTITVGSAWTTQPDSTSNWVAVDAAGVITAVAFESSVWLEEGEAATGFSEYQRATDVFDIRDALRFIPSTHNFMAGDNQAYNGVGTDTGTGNIYYGTSGFHRVRQGGLDPRLPLDGTAPNAFTIVSGVVGSAAAATLTDTGAFVGKTFVSEAINFTYDTPDDNGEEYIVTITAGDGIAQTRRIVSNSDDTLTLEHPWGRVPTAGDTYAVYQIWATPEAMNPSEGFSANWNNKQSRANDIMLSENGRNHRVEMILEQLSIDSSIDREDMRNLNKYVSGVTNPGAPGRYLLTRLQQAIAANGDCGTVDDELVANNAFTERGREFENPLLIEPAGTALADSAASRAPDYVKGWATQLAADIYGDEYDPASVSKLTSDDAIGWILHAIDSAAGDVVGSYTQVYSGDYFNGTDWKEVVRDSFCDYVSGNLAACSGDGSVTCSDDAQCDFGVCTGTNTCAGDAGRSCTEDSDCDLSPCSVGTKNRAMENYNHPLAALPCQIGCETPIQFDPTPRGNRGTWEQIVEVGPTVKGEFIFPLGQSGHVDGFAIGFSSSDVKQTEHTSTMQPLWRDWRFVPMLHVCDDVTLGGDEDGDTDDDGVLDAFERHYYAGSLANDGSSDTDGDGASLLTEYEQGSDPTLADTDEDGVLDGNDVAPQDRLCVAGTLKKLTIKDSTDPGKDKVKAKWEVPLNVCVGSDYQTACAVDADCGVAGRCRRIRVNPQRDTVRIVAADDTPLLDAEIPIAKSFWKNKNDAKFQYKDKDGVHGPADKVKVDLNEKKGVIRLQISAKNFDVPSAADVAEGAVGLAIGSRCFMETSTNCKAKNGKVSCKAN